MCVSGLSPSKPGIKAENSKLFTYYSELTAQDFQKDTPDKVMAGMLQEMKQDGLSRQKISNIVKTNRNFPLSLLENKEKMPKPKKQKLQVTMRKPDNQERGMNI